MEEQQKVKLISSGKIWLAITQSSNCWPNWLELILPIFKNKFEYYKIISAIQKDE